MKRKIFLGFVNGMSDGRKHFFMWMKADLNILLPGNMVESREGRKCMGCAPEIHARGEFISYPAQAAPASHPVVGREA